LAKLGVNKLYTVKTASQLKTPASDTAFEMVLRIPDMVVGGGGFLRDP
jgi:hypothetical protein